MRTLNCLCYIKYLRKYMFKAREIGPEYLKNSFFHVFSLATTAAAKTTEPTWPMCVTAAATTYATGRGPGASLAPAVSGSIAS